ncbi:MAG: hypothetical protein EA408_07915 [Marinilabiliales bacterium]|nr:MAG: hypothetical protein EA408_07915 [Marinilabiliales bacterium]
MAKAEARQTSVTGIPIEGIWLKAAVSGGLWASVEIILGSFLHNMRVPMAGSILASFGIVLMIAFYQVWPERGLIWRAGLICALMKSLSPSAVILGPMTGIMLEALLLEAGIALIGKNIAGYMAAGALALFSALLHKLFSLLLLYGLNILTIYLNLFHFASRQVNIQEANPWQLITAVGVFYLLFGALAALAGYFVGRRAAGAAQAKHPGTAQAGMKQPGTAQPEPVNPRTAHDEPAGPGTAQPEPAHHTVPLPVSQCKAIPPPANPAKLRRDAPPAIFTPSSTRFSLPLFILHTVAIPGGLLLVNFSHRTVAYPLIAAYSIFCLLRYKTIIKRFKKPLFWFQLLVIILLASVFLDGFDRESATMNWAGVLNGIDMNIRAILVVTGFSALSTELRNPLITAFLVRKGFRQLYMAISLAFGALPAMMEEISRPGRFFTSPFSSLREMVAKAPLWLENMGENSNRH